jgi:hypothetical protein
LPRAFHASTGSDRRGALTCLMPADQQRVGRTDYDHRKPRHCYGRPILRRT